MIGHDHPVERGDLFALARCHRWTPFGLSFPSMLTDSLPQPVSSCRRRTRRSEEHTSELQSLMRISYAVFCLKKKKKINNQQTSKLIKQHKDKTSKQCTHTHTTRK